MVGRQIHYAVFESVKKKGLITKQRQDYLHYLTAVGANFLNDFTELCLSDIRYPKNPKLYLSNDYNHRVSMIHIHISFDKRMEKIESLKSQFLVYYNQAIGSKKQRFESETCIPVQKGKNFSPDGICSYLDRVGKPTIFCIEVYN